MAAKIAPIVHESVTVPGVVFRTYPKTYGRRVRLDTLLAVYNQSMRELEEKRTLLLEEARNKTLEKMGTLAPKSESVIQISMAKADDGSKQMVADQTDLQNSPQFQTEMLKLLNWSEINKINEKTQHTRLEQLRPMYMAVYLHSVDGLEDEDDTPIRFANKMSEADRQNFFLSAPAVLIDEIFGVLDSEIVMNEVERANFELPTTGGAPAGQASPVPTTPADTTVMSADEAKSGSTVNAESRT